MRQLIFVLASLCVLLGFGVQAKQLEHIEAISLTSPAGGVRLNGVLRLPSGPGPFPAAVLLPERGPDASNPQSADNQLWNSLADYLVGQGVAVLRLHERGQGGSEGSATTPPWLNVRPTPSRPSTTYAPGPNSMPRTLASLVTAKAPTYPYWRRPSHWPPIL